MHFDSFTKDFRYAVRMLAKNPGFTLLAIGALALGIGATTAMFTVFDAVLVRPLRFPEPERLLMVWEVQPSGRNNVIQTQNFLDWRDRNRSFESIAAMLQLPTNLAGIGDPLQVTGLAVTSDFFRVLAIPPLIGRFIAPEEDAVGSTKTVVLSYGLFAQRYGARGDILGQKISVNGSPLEVVGVMPPGFALPNIKVDLYMPLQLPKSAPRDGRNFRAVARLRRGVSLEAAQSEMKAIARQTARERPEMNTNWSATAVPLLEQIVGGVRAALGVLFGAVVFLLLIACANVANLLLMRAVSRRREMTVRLALGAKRSDLLRQLIVESLLLASCGGVAGLALAELGIRTILASLPANFPLPRVQEIHIDSHILLFTIGTSLTVGMIFGILPAFSLRTERLSGALTESGRSIVRGQKRLGGLLVGVEVAVALLLVVGAGLLIRSFGRLTSVDAGFRSDHVLTARMLLLPTKYGQIERRSAFIQQILERVRSLPQVTSAGSIHFLPMIGTNSGTWYYRSDRAAPDPGNMSGGDVSVISPGYFQTLAIPLIAGRDFDNRDGINTPKVAILNQSAAQMLFPGEEPVGKHVTIRWDRQPDAEVVGVVADIRHDSLEHKPEPCVFLPASQEPHMLVSLVIRTSGSPELLARSVEEQIHAIDPEQGISEIKTMENVISESVASPRLQSILMGLFALVALALAAVGIYGTIAYSVAQRTREIGVRLAVGATPATVIGLVLRDAITMTAGGAAVGVAGAFGLTRYLQGMLYNVTPTDPLVFVTVVGTIFVVAAGACIVPAWRASRVDPATVLHTD